MSDIYKERDKILLSGNYDSMDSMPAVSVTDPHNSESESLKASLDLDQILKQRQAFGLKRNTHARRTHKQSGWDVGASIQPTGSRDRDSPDRHTKSYGLSFIHRNNMQNQSQPHGLLAEARQSLPNVQNFAMGEIDMRSNTFRTSQLVKKHRKNKTELFQQEFNELKQKFRDRKNLNVVLTRGEQFSSKPSERDTTVSPTSRKNRKVLLHTRQGIMFQNDLLN